MTSYTASRAAIEERRREAAAVAAAPAAAAAAAAALGGRWGPDSPARAKWDAAMALALLSVACAGAARGVCAAG